MADYLIEELVDMYVLMLNDLKDGHIGPPTGSSYSRLNRESMAVFRRSAHLLQLCSTKDRARLDPSDDHGRWMLFTVYQVVQGLA